jgi:hypothetical protein
VHSLGYDRSEILFGFGQDLGLEELCSYEFVGSPFAGSMKFTPSGARCRP